MRDALADMPADHAVIMDNWFPGTDVVEMRRGHASHATGMTGSVETLIEYVPLTGTGALFACENGNIRDVSTAGAVGAAVVTSRSNNRFQFVNIGTSGGQFLVAMNGADTPSTYDGSTWGAFGATGPTVANLIWCNLHQRRMWFGEEDSLSAWYLAVNAITGAATEFPLHGIAKLGGYIMAMGTWTRDSGEGMDDAAVFITSEGEAIVYAGIDPSAAATWELIGVFRIGKPIGRRCMIKAGGDLIIVTQDGFVSAQTILPTDRAYSRRVAISEQINKAVNDAVRTYKDVYGWQPFLYPRGIMMMFNSPVQANTEYRQFVFNTITGAPCRFTGVNAVCWGMLDDEPYFGGTDGVVYKFDTGGSDNGTAIDGDVLQAFNYFGSKSQKKAFKMAEPIFQSDGNPNAATDLNLDFQVSVPTSPPVASPETSARWGVSKWGVGSWGTGGQIYRGWRSVVGIARAAALRVRVSNVNARPAWTATNFIYVPGGAL